MATITQHEQDERVRVVAFISASVDHKAEIEAATLRIDKRELIERALRQYLRMEVQ